MAPAKTWVLLVNRNFQASGKATQVNTAAQDNINDLKEKTIKKLQSVRTDLNATYLSVWKTKGSKIIETTNIKRVNEILKSIDIEDEDTIEELDEGDQVVSLGLSNRQVLLMQPFAVTTSEDGALGAPIKFNLNLEYKDMFLHAHVKGNFIDDDFDSNDVATDNGEAPEFVQKYQEMLGRKRKVPDNMRSAETFMGQAFFKEYFDCSTEVPSGSSLIANLTEVKHAVNLTSFEGSMLSEIPDGGKRMLFKELDANWLFFFTFARHCRSLPSNIASYRNPEITVKFGQRSWPFMLIVEVDRIYHTYRPRSDFLVLKFDVPRVAVEVNSQSPDRPPVDHHRVILQGASIVRFANTFLDAYKKEKNFIFVAIFISDNGAAVRYLLYEKEGSRRVYHRKQVFQASETVGCLGFALELYNLASALNDESGDEDTRRKVEKLATSVSEASKEYRLPMFTSKFKGGEDQTEPNVRKKGDDGGANEQLEACGYKVVPDVLETDGGTWELISKLPPHILTVYRWNDRSKTELIAKHVREGSNEPDILKYLHTIRPQSPHIISFIEAIPSIATEWLILPKLYSIGDQLFMSRSGVRSRVQLGWGLIKGLAYLHEHRVAHRDIKPHNLVCDGDFRLQIIDFDVAIKVEDENTEIDEYRGTENWTAPEMGKEEGPTPMYSPIKADRWSCGRVLLHHIMVRGDKQLSKFADQLMANDPQQRPSLLEWPQFAAPPSVANVLKTGGRETRAWQEVDGESMNPPDAKKLRLVVTERRVQPVRNGLEASRPMSKVF